MITTEYPLHHIGYLTKDIAITARDWQQRLGYRIESAVIEDACQTASVQFLRQPRAAYWLECVAPIGTDSRLAGALAKGITLHHLCYEVNVLEQALRQLREQGCFVVHEPTNATAFPGRRIAWLMDRHGCLIEFLEAGTPPLSLKHLVTSL